MISLLLALLLFAAQEPIPIEGQPITFAADHDGANTTHYRMEINGAPVSPTLTKDQALSNGVVKITVGGLTAGSYTARIVAVSTVTGLQTKSDSKTFLVAASTPGTPPPQTPFEQFIEFPGAPPPPPPPVDNPASRRQSTAMTFPDATSFGRSFPGTMQLGSVSLIGFRFHNSSSVLVKSLTSSTAPCELVDRIVASASATAVELWTCQGHTTTEAMRISVSLSGAANGVMSMVEVVAPGSGSIAIQSFASSQSLPETKAHVCSNENVPVRLGDALFAIGVVSNSDGESTPGAGWSLVEELSTRGLSIDRYPAADGVEQGPWTTGNLRTTTCLMGVVRRN